MKKPDSYAIRPIRTDANYRDALAVKAPYFDNEPKIDSDAGAHFEAMVTLIEAFEARHYPNCPTDSKKAIFFRMEHIHHKLFKAKFISAACRFLIASSSQIPSPVIGSLLSKIVTISPCDKNVELAV